MGHFQGRRTLTIAALALFFFPGPALFAEPVTLSEARQATDTFLRRRVTRPTGASTMLSMAAEGGTAVGGLLHAGVRELRDSDGTLLAYVADLEPCGFVVLSADTSIRPVIAYSFRSPFPDGKDGNNPLYRMVREDMRLRLAALAGYPELKASASGGLWDRYLRGQASEPNGTTFQQWPPEGTTSTGGWLETAWEQGPPYNRFCPRDPIDGARSYTGCAATALAQIVNYHRQCTVAFHSTDSYTSYSGMQFDADSALYDFPSFAVLNGYLDAIQTKYGQGVNLNDTDIAALNLACGSATKMDYSSEGSGATPSAMQEALLGKFGFYSADLYGGLSRDSCRVLQENMRDGLPALVSICSPDGLFGHVVVCDGYNTDDEFHCNFGWGRDYPGKIADIWYHLPTDLMDYQTVITETLLNIRPVRPALELDPATMSFYSVPGEDSAPRVLRLENNVAGLEVDSISSPDGFTIAPVSGEFSSHVDSFQIQRPRAGASIRVKFHPERSGGYYGTLVIRYGSGSVRHVIVQGWSYTGGTRIHAGEVSGVWSQAGSPYFVMGDVEVAERGELVVEPGVKIFFVGPYGMTIGANARLAAQGSIAEPIEFTAWNRDAGWGGLRFRDSGDDDRLSYCSITFVRRGAEFVPYEETEANPSASVTDSGEDQVGGAICCLHSDPTIENCRITNNVGDKGGAVYCLESSPVISNTLIANNAALAGLPRSGGICCEQWGVPDVRNCTIVHNSPGGVFTTSWEGTNLTNTIVWGNDIFQIQAEECAPTVSFCDVQDGYPGPGNLDLDPCFFDPSAGSGADYDGPSAHWALRSCSPCINSGTPTEGLASTDLAGGARVYSDVIDMGAYENQSRLPLITLSASATLDAGFVPLDTNSLVLLDIVNTGAEDVLIEGLIVADADRVFSLLTPIRDRVLSPGSSVPVKIAFRPRREKGYTGFVGIHSSADNGQQRQVALSGVGVSGTVVPGGSVRGTWQRTQSPYTVTGDIRVPKGETLTIEPGVVVRFAGRFRLTVGYRATLRALGTPQDHIIFTAADTDEGWFGVRFHNSGADDTLKYCTLEYANKPRIGGGGYLDLWGGAVLCCSPDDGETLFPVPSSPTIDSCRFTYNWACTGGAIMCTDDSEAVITGNTIVENTADIDGGGIALYYAPCTVANNVIARNSALVGGGLINYLGCPSITNNTIVRNRPSALQLEATTLAGLVFESSVLLNNIIWENEISAAEGIPAGEYEIRFNDIQGGWEGEGNLNVDPCFAAPVIDDYHLKSRAGRWDPAARNWVADNVTSPCIDAGDPGSEVADEPLPNGGRIDMGAHGGTAEASKSPGD